MYLNAKLSFEFGKISKISRQAGRLGKKLEKKIWYIVFSPMFNKSHLVHFNIIMFFFCHYQDMLSCIFKRVMQIALYRTGVLNYDILYLWSA